MLLQTRPYDGLKDLDPKGRTVQFYGSAFGVLDAHDDIVVRGAFAKTIQENGPASAKPRIKHLLQHNSNRIVGKFTELVEDERGLLCTSLLADTADGKDTLKLYELDLFEHSIGFNTIKQEYDSTTGVRRITEVKLWEVSAVTWGACEDTPLVSLKSMAHADRAVGYAARISKLCKALRTGEMQDATYQSLEAELSALETAYKELVTLPSEVEPAPATQQKQEPNEAELVSLFKSQFTLI